MGAGNSRRTAPEPEAKCFSEVAVSESRQAPAIRGFNDVVAGLALSHCNRAIVAGAEGEALTELYALQALLQAAVNSDEERRAQPAPITLGTLKRGLTGDIDLMSHSAEEGKREDSEDQEVNDWLQGLGMLGDHSSHTSASALLCDAAASGDIERLRQLSEGGGDVNRGDYDKRTAMHLAASEGLLEVVTMLIDELHAEHSPQDRWGNTPLDDALRCAHYKVADFLTVRGASTGVAGAAKAVEVNRPAAELCDAAAAGQDDTLRRLVQVHGVDVNLGDYDKRTAIHLAASEGLLKTVRVLVEELDADISAYDRWGGTALDDALRAGHSEVADLLQSMGGKRGTVPQSSGLSGAADPSSDLCDAAARGDVERLRSLVTQGLPVNGGDYDKRTAMHLAASEGLLEVVTMLIDELHAEHSPQDRWGNTPLDDALRTQREAVAAFLRSRGATSGSVSGVAAGGRGTRHDLWVVPEAMEQVFSSRLFAPLAMHLEGAQLMVTQAIGGWEGDVIAIDEASSGHALLLVGQALLAHHDLFDALHLDRATVRRFLLALEAGYGQGAYHNAVHGADVAISVHLFLTQFGFSSRLSKLELFAILLAALCHDFNRTPSHVIELDRSPCPLICVSLLSMLLSSASHQPRTTPDRCSDPASSNAHEVRVGTERAIRHSDASVLEKHHLNSTFSLLQHPPLDLLARLSSEDRATVRSIVIDAVLATDLAQHLHYVTRLRALAATRGAASHSVLSVADGNAWSSPLRDPKEVDTRLLLAIAIKWADLGHATKPRSQHLQWTERVTRELWQLGDKERALGIPLSPLCDREKDSNIAKSQVGFFKFLTVPFYSLVADLVDGDMVPWQRVKDNLRQWTVECEATEARRGK